MKKQSLQILHRYRQHLLEREQALIQDKIAEENVQKARVLQLQARIQETHEAKLKAATGAELNVLDEAAAYLHGRAIMAHRALSLAKTAREEAMARTIKAKEERDQVGIVIENGRLKWRQEQDHAERVQLDDLTTTRYAMTMGGL